MKFVKYLALIVITAFVSFVFTLNVYPKLRANTRTASGIINTPYYKIKNSIHETMPKRERPIAFLGDSLTDYVQFDAIFPDIYTRNFGIAGDTTVGVLNRLNAVIDSNPAKVFILIGTNDIVFNSVPSEIAANIRLIIQRLKANLPDTKIYVETLIPVNSSYKTNRPGNIIKAINELLPEIAKDFDCTLIDTYKFFAENDELPERYTIDGLHLNGAGILHWMEFLTPYIKE